MVKFTVIVTEPIHSDGIRLLEEEGVEVVELPPGSDEDSLLKEVPRADALITRGSIEVTREIMMASPRLKAIGVHGVGCDHVNLKAAEELEKTVINTPTALTATVAEMTIGLMLALTRRVVSADKAVRAGEWNRKYGDLIGSELMGKKIGIVGLGRIGAAVARRLRPFRVEIFYNAQTRKPELEAELGVRWAELDELLKICDIISLHIPLTPQTSGLISKREFDLMKEGVYLLNTARGKIIDSTALVEALNTGKLAGAAIDHFPVEPLSPKDPLTSMDKVILTPHLGASSREAMSRMAVQVSEGVLITLKGGIPENPVVI